MSPRQILRVSSFALGLSIAQAALAQRSIILGTGVSGTFGQIIENIVSFLAGSIVALCTALFILGALFMVLSRGKEDQVKRGKDLMLGSLMGLAVVLGSYAIIQVVAWALF